MACGQFSVFEVYLIHSLPLMTSLEFVTQKYEYTIYKKDGFSIPASWVLYSVLIYSTNFLYLWYALFKACQIFHSSHSSHLSIAKQRYLTLIHLHSCDTRCSVSSLFFSERNASLFLFSNRVLPFTQWNKQNS